MYKIEIEKADGEVYFRKEGKLYERDFANEIIEYLWNLHAHTGNYASFRVVNADTGVVYAELEC
jgi:hypothetical protein